MESSPLDIVFSRFCNRIVSTSQLHVTANPNDRYNSRQILRHASNVVTALLVERDRGRCVYLPHFGDAVGQVVQTIMRDVLPTLSSHLVEDPEFRWLTQTQYLMPPLARIRTEEEATTHTYEEERQRLTGQWNDEWATTQTPWNDLLTSTGDPLKKAVKRALETLGASVTDVDEYWKTRAPERQKEEDLWIGFGAEADPSVAGVALAEVKSNRRGTASEDDYGAVIKYLNRRKNEYRNLDLTGMLLITIPTRQRPLCALRRSRPPCRATPCATVSFL